MQRSVYPGLAVIVGSVFLLWEAVALAQAGSGPQSTTPPAALPAYAAQADGCVPYWHLVDIDCDQQEMVRAGLTGHPYCDPVHERVTRSVLRGAGVGKDAPEDPVVQEYLRGVLWNDDPEGLLIDDKGRATRGVAWCTAFRWAQVSARSGRSGSLLQRSHFGDLQGLHGMATHPKETNLQTFKSISPWVEFTYRVASGEIAGTTRLKDVPVKGIAAMFPTFRTKTVNNLFGIRSAGDVKARAFGSLLHFVQDSLGDGHAARTGQPAGASPIAHYFTYAHGVHALHRGDSGWREVWPDDTSLASWPEAGQAILIGVDALRLVQHHKPWTVAKEYLGGRFFSYVNFDAPAVPWEPEKKR